MNLVWYLKGTQLKTLRRENKSSETFTESRMKKASQTRCLTFAPYAWRRFTPWGVMRCRRGLRTTHYIVLPRLTDYAAKICSFSLFAKPVLINFKRCIKMGIPSLNIGIKIKFDFPFLSPFRWHRTNIANIPNLVRKNRHFHGQNTHFSISVRKIRHFHGRSKGCDINPNSRLD